MPFPILVSGAVTVGRMEEKSEGTDYTTYPQE